MGVGVLEGEEEEDQEVPEMVDPVANLDEEIRMWGLRLAVEEVVGDLNSSSVPI